MYDDIDSIHNIKNAVYCMKCKINLNEQESPSQLPPRFAKCFFCSAVTQAHPLEPDHG